MKVAGRNALKREKEILATVTEQYESETCNCVSLKLKVIYGDPLVWSIKGTSGGKNLANV